VQAALAEVLKHPSIWRGDGYSQSQPDVIGCGHPSLAAALPGGGWPGAAVTEVVAARAGCGELKLLMPVIADLTRQGKPVLLVAPPHIPYAPAWQAAGIDLRHLTWAEAHTEYDALWTMEQALREPACGAVVGWFAQSLTDRQGRRLQLAAEAGGGCGFVLRQGKQDVSSPFPLRLSVEPLGGGIAVHVLKRRGAPLGRPVFLHQEALNSASQTGAQHALAGTLSAHTITRRAASRPLAQAA